MNACTHTVGEAPYIPPTRQLAASWRRCLQERVTLTSSQSTPFNASDWFADKYNTTGFSSLFVHSVTVWSSPSNPTKEDSIILVPETPGASRSSAWSAQAFSGQVNRSAVVKVNYPNHLSGPFARSDTICTITTTASAVIVELDCTFV